VLELSAPSITELPAVLQHFWLEILLLLAAVIFVVVRNLVQDHKRREHSLAPRAANPLSTQFWKETLFIAEHLKFWLVFVFFLLLALTVFFLR
jgi:hypothetical protein